jgi:hypothetical protein
MTVRLLFPRSNEGVIPSACETEAHSAASGAPNRPTRDLEIRFRELRAAFENLV